MKKRNLREALVRLATVVILVIFTVTSCMNHYIPVPSEPVNTVANVQLSFLNEDTNHGRTILSLIEDEGTYITSAEGQEEDEVSLVSDDAGVMMMFSKGADFPNRIKMNSDEFGTIYGIFSEYDFETSSYNVELATEEGESQSLSDLILNKNIFSLYEHNPNWTESQNLRAHRMAVGMGLYASLLLNLENLSDEASLALSRNVWNWLKKNIIEPAKNVLTAVAVTAIIVAVIVVPVVNFVAPALTLSSATAWGVAATATAWYGTLETVEGLGDGNWTIEDIKIIIDEGGNSVTTQGNDDDQEPATTEYLTGKMGPASVKPNHNSPGLSTILIDKRHSGFEKNIELVTGHVFGEFQYDGKTYFKWYHTSTWTEATAIKTIRSQYIETSGWRLPTIHELSVIYELFLIYGLISIDNIRHMGYCCNRREGRGSIWTSDIVFHNGMQYAYVAIDPISAHTDRSRWAENFGLRSISDENEASFCLVRDYMGE